MADIIIGGTLHSVATGNVVARADEIQDNTTFDTPKKQDSINAEVDEALSGYDGRITNLENAVGPSGTVDSKIANAKTEILGDVKTYNTLGKLEDAIQSETAARTAADNNRYTKDETYSKEQLDNLITTPDQKFVTVEATEQDSAITDILTEDGEADTIYRVANWDGTGYDVTCYSEYAWDGSDYVLLSVKDPGIDNVPTKDSNNLVKSGGIREAIDEVGEYTPELDFVRVYTDSEDRILWGIKANGDIYYGLGCPQQIKDYVESHIQEALAEYVQEIESPEFVRVYTDADNRVLWAIKKDGDIYFGAGVPQQIVYYVQQAVDEIKADTEESLEDFAATLDTILAKIPDMGFIEDPEERMEVTTDDAEKIVSYRDKEGVLHEEIGIATKQFEAEQIELKDTAVDDLHKYLKEKHYIGTNDYSDATGLIELPTPEVCAVINLGVNSQIEAKGVDYPTYLEYWDKYGNYFKKPILLNAQGSSSMAYHVKNQAFDLDDGSSIKFGNWVPQDSFHLKKYFIDVFRGQCVAAYWLTEQVYMTRPYGQRRPWDFLNEFSSVSNSKGKFNQDFDTGALAHPDGFPVKVFFNGKSAGIYAFNLKKSRDNYYCKKANPQHLILDGILGPYFWGANGDLTTTGDTHTMVWEDFEIRNPKSLVYATAVDGSYKYDADVKETEIAGNNGLSQTYDDWSSSVTNYAVGKVVKHLDNYFLNTIANNTQAPVLQSGKNKNSADSPDYKDKTGCHWINCTLSVNAKYYINRLTTALAAIEAAADKKDTFESFFNVPFLIDYDLISQVLYHYDGYRKNWIWITNNGDIWSPTLYDLDSIFGQSFDGKEYVSASVQDILGTTADSPAFYFKTGQLYWEDAKARYAELREKKVFDVDNIVGLLEKWVNWCGYDNLKEDIEDIVTSPYKKNDAVQLDSDGNYKLLPNTPSYRNGDESIEYMYPPTGGGWYNSVLRVRNWLEARIANLDEYYEYGQN